MPPFDHNTLRQHAEEFLDALPNGLYSGQLDNIKTLIHELSVHQIELEMQNQALKDTYQKLLNAKNNFSLLFDQAPAGYLKMDQQGRILKANQTLRDMLNLSILKIEGQYLTRFIHSDDAAMFNSRYPAFFSKPENKTIELRLLKQSPQRTLLRVQLNGRLIAEQNDNAQSHYHLLVIVADITERHRLEEEKELAAKVFETSEEAIIITDSCNCILSVNQSFMDITGFQHTEVIGRTLVSVLFPAHDTKTFQAIWSKLVISGRWKGEVEHQRRNGSRFTASISISSSTDLFGKIKNCIVIFSDITQKKLNDSKIEFLAHYDILTKLPNRSHFTELLNNAILHASRTREFLGVLFLDLDRFKLLNDTCGHLAGDVLLQNVANRLQACIRETDNVSRFAGDEFVILLTHFKDLERCKATSEQIVEKLLHELSLPHEIGSIQFNTSVSIGIALFPTHGTSAPELIKNADTAMYAAKEAGRNGYCLYNDDMRQQAIARSNMEFDLQIADRERQFHLAYQPFITLADGQLYGFEALLRWQHPLRGELKPDSFLAIAEDNGMINSIGQWVLQNACQQASFWRQQHHQPPLKISVNMSARQFLQPNLVRDIQTLFTTYQLEGSALILEITESIAMQNIGESIRVMHELRELGILLSLDDFGTGYSSLAYLKKLPLSILKIDQSFVHDLGVEKDNALIKSIIDIGRNMDLVILAEGIEHPHQVELLLKYGCQLGQGYVFSPPLTATDIVLPF
jgi:diguanylate cyclase (GGDEF)-like protein/PAS domain S-box-containing protein